MDKGQCAVVLLLRPARALRPATARVHSVALEFPCQAFAFLPCNSGCLGSLNCLATAGALKYQDVALLASGRHRMAFS